MIWHLNPGNILLKYRGFGNLSKIFGCPPLCVFRWEDHQFQRTTAKLRRRVELAPDVLLSIRMRVLTPADPQVAETIPAPPSADSKIELSVWLAAGAIAALVVAIYAAPFGALVQDWWTDNQGASYGILIPPLVLYIAYARRAQTLSAPASQGCARPCHHFRVLRAVPGRKAGSRILHNPAISGNDASRSLLNFLGRGADPYVGFSISFTDHDDPAADAGLQPHHAAPPAFLL